MRVPALSIDLEAWGRQAPVVLRAGHVCRPGVVGGNIASERVLVSAQLEALGMSSDFSRHSPVMSAFLASGVEGFDSGATVTRQ